MGAAVDIPDLPPARLPAEAWLDRIGTLVGSGLDAAMLAGMQRVVDALFAPTAENLRSLRDSGRRLADPALHREPRRFFDFGPLPARPEDDRARVRRELDGGLAIGRTLAVRYRPSGLTGEPEGEILERIPFEHWQRREGTPRGVVVCLHGFTMGRPRVDAFVLLAGQWFRRGLDVVLLTLPYHGRRTPRDARFSGEHFAVPHVGRLSEAVRQAVFEVDVVVRWLRETRRAPVGLLGLSLGGYLTALEAALDPSLDFAIPMVPPVCIGDLAWRFLRPARERGEALPPELDRSGLRALFRVHSPLAQPLAIPRERTLIVAGRGDRIVPPEHPTALWEHWGRPSIHWFSGSHLAPFGRGGIARAVVRHLRGLDIL